MGKTVEELKKRSRYEEDNVEVPPGDIVAYNELRSCADLYRMHKQKILEIQPDFQRNFVWKGPDQTRFIDSLIKQLPIPSMCFAQDYKAQEWIVIDGLQRISTILRFLKGEDWKLSNLDDIDPAIKGKSAAAIKTSKTSLHDYYARVENLSVPITVLRCDFKKKSHMDYLFTIFHRLNTGGMKLNNQEIRNCIFGGIFNNLLKDLDGDQSWRRINNMKAGQSYRFSKQELILRFFAFYDRQTEYAGHLAKFLNSYMHDNREPSPEFIEEKRDLFRTTVKCVDEKIYNQEARPKTSITVLDAILFGVGKNIEYLSTQSSSAIQLYHKSMMNSIEFSEELLKEGLSGKQRVIDRLNLSERIFSGQ